MKMRSGWTREIRETYYKRYPWVRRGFVGEEEKEEKENRALKGPCEGGGGVGRELWSRRQRVHNISSHFE